MNEQTINLTEVIERAMKKYQKNRKGILNKYLIIM